MWLRGSRKENYTNNQPKQMTFGVSCYLAPTPVVDVRMMPTNCIAFCACVYVNVCTCMCIGTIWLVCVRGMLLPCHITSSVILYTPRFFSCIVCSTSIIKGRKNVYVSLNSYRAHIGTPNIRITFQNSVAEKRLFLNSKILQLCDSLHRHTHFEREMFSSIPANNRTYISKLSAYSFTLFNYPWKNTTLCRTLTVSS